MWQNLRDERFVSVFRIPANAPKINKGGSGTAARPFSANSSSSTRYCMDLLTAAACIDHIFLCVGNLSGLPDEENLHSSSLAAGSRGEALRQYALLQQPQSSSARSSGRSSNSNSTVRDNRSTVTTLGQFTYNNEDSDSETDSQSSVVDGCTLGGEPANKSRIRKFSKPDAGECFRVWLCTVCLQGLIHTTVLLLSEFVPAAVPVPVPVPSVRYDRTGSGKWVAANTLLYELESLQRSQVLQNGQ